MSKPSQNGLPLRPRSTIAADQALPLLDRLYAARGADTAASRDLSLKHLAPPTGLPGIGVAASLLAHAVQSGKRILVVGDYDCDGSTSTALAVSALYAMGADEDSVNFLVPDRVTQGYGLTPALVEEAMKTQPDLLLTVDNGVSSIEGVTRAREAGLCVVVTDHHLPGDALPDAHAIVNPQLPGNTFPSTALAGVGVIFYVMIALRTELKRQGWFDTRDEPQMAQFLDLVAFGTIADVVPLDYNNRILIANGLARIRSGLGRPGISALLAVAGREPDQVRASDIGFGAGPRLNAAGRLDNMSIGIWCLLAESVSEAAELALELDDFNATRKELEQHAVDAAVEQAVEQVAGLGEQHTLCLYGEAWHEGVVGLVASRIKERYNRPVVAFAAGQGDVLKGSARSIPGIHIRDALVCVDAEHPGLIHRFGGHAMAAGLTIFPERLSDFSTAFEAAVTRLADPQVFEPFIVTDGALDEADLSLDCAQTLADGGPWGQGFPEPVFDGVFKVMDAKPLSGGAHVKLRVRPLDAEPETAPLDAILFHVGRQDWTPALGPVQLVYKLSVNEYRGVSKVQLMIEAASAWAG